MAKLLIILTLLVIIAAVWISRFIQLDQIPHLDPEEWWGPKELKELNDTSVRPFKVEFGEEVISDLKRRLNNFRAPPPPLEGVAFQYGFNSNQLDAWRRYWAEDYDFHEREEFLNKFPQLKTNIQGLDIHFIRVKPEMARILFLVPFYAIAGVAIYYAFLKKPEPLPEITLDSWWGPNELKGKQDTSIRPFKVDFSESMVKDLRERLKNHRKFTPPLEGIAFQYGFNTKQLDSWVQYWAEKYDFQARAKFLNQFPQFKTNIQGLDIHFIRVKPEVPAGVEVVPMLLMHGWPGSVREFYEALPLLTAVSKDRDFAIEAIVPSLPGYGFSDAAVRPGLDTVEVAVIFRNLMHRLGFKKYYIQGGDWGSAIGSNMATLFPDEVLGWHTNFAMARTTYTNFMTFVGTFWPSLVVESHLKDRMYPLGTVFSNLLEESGYMHIQATKPDTVGVGLSDSPSGLLAYIIEKFSTWTNPEWKKRPDGGHQERFTRDKLLDNLMLYWSTNSITTSMRLYAESIASAKANAVTAVPSFVPTWVVQAKHELLYQPPGFIRQKYPNLISVTVLEDGGHFLALELPAIFTKDVLTAVTEFRKLDRTKLKTEL